MKKIFFIGYMLGIFQYGIAVESIAYTKRVITYYVLSTGKQIEINIDEGVLLLGATDDKNEKQKRAEILAKIKPLECSKSLRVKDILKAMNKSKKTLNSTCILS